MFVFINGLSPDIFIEWCDIIGICRDNPAKEHMKYLFRNLEEGNPKFSNYWAFNVAMHRMDNEGSVLCEIDARAASGVFLIENATRFSIRLRSR